jgi:hypothetical protein
MTERKRVTRTTTVRKVKSGALADQQRLAQPSLEPEEAEDAYRDEELMMSLLGLAGAEAPSGAVEDRQHQKVVSDEEMYGFVLQEEGQ